MKYAAVFAVAAAGGALAAQGLAEYIPTCAVKCLEDGMKAASKCDTKDVMCFCVPDNYYDIYDASVGCVLVECGNDLAVGMFLPPLCTNPPTRQSPKY